MYISIDLGGTNTRVASSLDLDPIHKEEKFETNTDINIQRNLISKAISVVSEGQEVKGICLGLPALLNKKGKKIIKAANIHSYNGLSFNDFFDKKYNLVVENDADLAGLAEAVKGAGKDFDVISYLTFSTGVGGARIANKKIDESYSHMEPGHMIVNFEGEVTPQSDLRGSLGTYLSGARFEKNYGVSPYGCVDEKIWMDYTAKLAVGLNNVVAMWAPDAIVLGGGMINNHWDLIYPLLRQNLKSYKFFDIPQIKKSKFEDEAGIVGGFVRLKNI